MKKISGIYKIESKIKPRRIYIGSTKNISQRWNDHLKRLRTNRHENRKLQNHYNKYRETDLQFSVLLGCDKEDLIKIEQYFIDSYNPYFNICKKANSNLGIKRTEEHIRKWLESRRRNGSFIMSEEARRKISESLKGLRKGIKLSEEHIKKLSESHKGQVAWNKGKVGVYSDETRRKISEALKGNKINLGKHHTDETKQKISKANMGRVSWNKGKKKLEISLN
jgi:group I intron endonuclease